MTIKHQNRHSVTRVTSVYSYLQEQPEQLRPLVVLALIDNNRILDNLLCLESLQIVSMDWNNVEPQWLPLGTVARKPVHQRILLVECSYSVSESRTYTSCSGGGDMVGEC